MDDRIIGLTVNIVSAYVGANDVAAVQIPGLIREVRQAPSTVGQPPVEPLAPQPAVAAEKSVFADHLVCLDCGGSFKTLRRHVCRPEWRLADGSRAHLSADHELTPNDYRTKWGLAASYPMVAADYAAARSASAKATGLGRKVDAPLPQKKRAGRLKRK